jgi:hypothetical protein
MGCEFFYHKLHEKYVYFLFTNVRIVPSISSQTTIFWMKFKLLKLEIEIDLVVGWLLNPID